MLNTEEIQQAIADARPAELDRLGVPRPHFLRSATLLHQGRTLVGEVSFPSSYEAVLDRGGRVNAAESLHAAWNAAHIIASGLGGAVLRATRVTITPGYRHIPADTPLVIIAHLDELVKRQIDHRGGFTAEIRDYAGHTLETTTVEFWAGIRRAAAAS